MKLESNFRILLIVNTTDIEIPDDGVIKDQTEKNLECSKSNYLNLLSVESNITNHHHIVIIAFTTRHFHSWSIPGLSRISMLWL